MFNAMMRLWQNDREQRGWSCRADEKRPHETRRRDERDEARPDPDALLFRVDVGDYS